MIRIGILRVDPVHYLTMHVEGAIDLVGSYGAQVMG